MCIWCCSSNTTSVTTSVYRGILFIGFKPDATKAHFNGQVNHVKTCKLPFTFPETMPHLLSNRLNENHHNDLERPDRNHNPLPRYDMNQDLRIHDPSPSSLTHTYTPHCTLIVANTPIQDTSHLTYWPITGDPPIRCIPGFYPQFDKPFIFTSLSQPFIAFFVNFI